MSQEGTSRACVGIGSNIGDRAGTIGSALRAMDESAGVRVIARSSVFETDPVGPVVQGRFLNAAAVVRTSLAPRAILTLLQEIERAHGRDRRSTLRWGPRTLDLDLLLYDEIEIDEPGLVLPHPRLHERAFVLEPLAEIAPDWIVPGRARTVEALRRLLHGVRQGAS